MTSRSPQFDSVIGHSMKHYKCYRLPGRAGKNDPHMLFIQLQMLPGVEMQGGDNSTWFIRATDSGVKAALDHLGSDYVIRGDAGRRRSLIA